MNFKYTVYYTENGKKKDIEISLDSDCQKPTTTMVFSRFKKKMGGITKMKKYNIFVKTIKQSI